MAVLLAAPAVLAGQSSRIEKLDLFPQFLAWWTETKTASRSVRARRFIELVVKPHAGLFDGFTGQISEERAVRYLEEVGPLMDEIGALHHSIAGEFDARLAQFRQALPDFAWSGSVVFMPTLFGFNAGGGHMDGTSYLIFGLDTIARIHGAKADLSVLFAHELFHLYHGAIRGATCDGTRLNIAESPVPARQKASLQKAAL